MKSLLTIELCQTLDGRFFCVVRAPGKDRDYVTADTSDGRRAVLRGYELLSRIQTDEG